MPFMSLKIRSRSPSLKLAFALPWCFPVLNLGRMHQLFLQILRRKHLSYAITRSMTFVTLTIRTRLPSSNLVFALCWCFCAPNLVRVHQIVLQILSGNHFKWPYMTFVRSRSQGSNLISAYRWCYMYW